MQIIIFNNLFSCTKLNKTAVKLLHQTGSVASCTRLKEASCQSPVTDRKWGLLVQCLVPSSTGLKRFTVPGLPCNAAPQGTAAGALASLSLQPSATPPDTFFHFYCVIHRSRFSAGSQGLISAQHGRAWGLGEAGRWREEKKKQWEGKMGSWKVV